MPEQSIYVRASCRDARLLCLFRFKIWWSIPRVGNSASDIPAETQMLLLEANRVPTSDGNTHYILFLPILDGETRCSLQGNSADELQVCVETGLVSPYPNYYYLKSSKSASSDQENNYSSN